MKLIARSFAGFFSVILGALLLLAVFHFTLWAKEPGPAIKVDSTALDRSPQLGNSFAPVVKRVMPSVVNIYSTQFIHERLRRNPLLDDPRFRQFFGDPTPDDEGERTRRERSLGSGIIVSPDGYILTANHVVDGADEIKVKVDDKKEYTAAVIGKDEATDVAVLKIDAQDLPAITLGDSDQLEVGDVTLAIGNPFGVGRSVTMGIVSALGRKAGYNRYESFIQTDAAINPGNSGGALVDAQGRLIGINTMIKSSSYGSEGVGFAVPVNLARHVMESLIAGGKVSRGYLGVVPQDLDAKLAMQFGLPNQNGALVGDVQPDTPAETAGIKSGDVIVAINGKDIADANALRLAVSDYEPGTKLDVKIIRDGNPKNVTIALAAMPGDTAQNGRGQKNSDNDKTDALDGVTVDDVNSDARQQLQIPDAIHGAIISDVNADSNAADAGLQRNDVIVSINRQPVSGADNAISLSKAAKGDQILVKVWRRLGDFGGTRFISVDNTKRQKK